MGRQGGDATMVTSSIALLQERFRQLQKVREKREEKELLRLFSESAHASPSICYEPNRLPFQQELMIRRYRQPLQDSLSLGPNSQSRQTSFRAMAIPESASLWPNSVSTSSTSKNFENSDDVDTSLHL
ncbi:hypothetical protein PTKIN_Ptkin15bG0158700 [Pterospermum kingtungense]